MKTSKELLRLTDEYIATLYPKGVTTDQRISLRCAFAAGMSIGFDECLDAGTSDPDDEKCGKALVEHQATVRRFAMEVHTPNIHD